MAIRYTLPPENAFDKLMNETLPRVLGDKIAANERAADRASTERIQSDILADRKADRDLRIKTADDRYSLQQQQMILEDRDRNTKNRLERNRQDFLEDKANKEDEYNKDISAVSIIEKIPEYGSRVTRANSVLESGAIKSPRAIARLEGVISDSNAVIASRKAEIGTALEIGVISQKAHDSILQNVNLNDEAYNKSYQIIIADAIDKTSQPRKLAYNDYQTINKRIAALSSTGLANAQKIETVQPGSVQAVRDEITALEEQKKTIKKELLDTEETSDGYKYSPNVQRIINKMSSSGEIDESTVGTLSQSELEELEEFMLSRAAGANQESKKTVPPQLDPDAPITGIQIMSQEQPETKQLGFIPSGEFSGKQLNAGRLRQIITKEFNQNRIAESRNLNRVPSEEYTFAADLARQLGFSSAEELNTERGIKALRNYYRNI